MKIAIIGAGTAGLASALLLSRDGHAVQVFERVPEPGPVGAGFMLQPTGVHVLRELGLSEAVLAKASPVARLPGTTRGGRAVIELS